MITRILLVEDNEISREILARRLRKAGYEVLEAEDGEAAVKAATELSPAVVLMDMNLPKIDGWEAIRELRRSPSGAHTPVIALTAHSLPADRNRALAAGCDEFESKPVEFRSLLRKIETLLARQPS